MNIPMVLRHIKPGVAHLVTNVFCQHPDFLNFLPATTPKQHIWLPVVNWAFHKVNADFARWAAKHVPKIPGRRDQEGRLVHRRSRRLGVCGRAEPTIRHPSFPVHNVAKDCDDAERRVA
jgi:hypothetical protein